MFEIISATNAHTSSVEHLLDRAFGPCRHNKRSYHFREHVADVSTLRFVALADGELLGTIRFWPVVIGEQQTAALLLGPLGVEPSHQGTGVGAGLMRHGMNTARGQGHRLVILVGELDYYGRFGFASAHSRGITMPGEQGHRVLVRELVNNALYDVTGAIKSIASLDGIADTSNHRAPPAFASCQGASAPAKPTPIT